MGDPPPDFAGNGQPDFAGDGSPAFAAGHMARGSLTEVGPHSYLDFSARGTLESATGYIRFELLDVEYSIDVEGLFVVENPRWLLRPDAKL